MAGKNLGQVLKKLANTAPVFPEVADVEEQLGTRKPTTSNKLVPPTHGGTPAAADIGDEPHLVGSGYHIVTTMDFS